MAYVLPLNGQSIYTAAALAGVPVEEITKMNNESEAQYKKEKDREWAIGILGKDEEWYENTLKKVAEIKATLPEGLDYKEETKRLYGWIVNEIDTVVLSIPMEMDKEYAKAGSIELILTNPDMYLKIIHWD